MPTEIITRKIFTNISNTRNYAAGDISIKPQQIRTQRNYASGDISIKKPQQIRTQKKLCVRGYFYKNTTNSNAKKLCGRGYFYKPSRDPGRGEY